MKKRIIALMSAMAMVLPMTFATVASASTGPRIEVKYDAVASTDGVAVVKVYAKGFPENAVGTLSIRVKYDPTVVDEAKAYTNRKDGVTLVAQDTFDATLGVNKSKDSITFSATSADYDLEWTQDEPVMTANLPLLANKEVKKFAFTLDADNSTFEINEGDGLTDITDIVASNSAGTLATYLPVSAKATGTVVADDASADPATYFSTETSVVDKATPYWYATIDSAAKKKEANIGANIAAGTTVKLGLVSVGSISDAKIVWE